MTNRTEEMRMVPFHGDTLYVVERNGEPYVPMRPIVEGMGLNWPGQYVKIVSHSRWASTVAEITIVAQDGKQRPMTCVPLRKIAGWLMSIYPNKVRADLREDRSSLSTLARHSNGVPGDLLSLAFRGMEFAEGTGQRGNTW